MPDPTDRISPPRPEVATPTPTTPVGDSGVPKELRYTGLIFSFLLVVAGLLAMATYPRLYAIGGLSACIGFGIALAVFGTRSSGRFKGFLVVGSVSVVI